MHASQCCQPRLEGGEKLRQAAALPTQSLNDRLHGGQCVFDAMAQLVHQPLALLLTSFVLRDVDESRHDAVDPVVHGAIRQNTSDEVPPLLTTDFGLDGNKILKHLVRFRIERGPSHRGSQIADRAGPRPKKSTATPA